LLLGTLGKYIQLLVRNAGIFEHTRLLVCGDSLRARARSLIEHVHGKHNIPCSKNDYPNKASFLTSDNS
jgi:hypothetical protein